MIFADISLPYPSQSFPYFYGEIYTPVHSGIKASLFWLFHDNPSNIILNIPDYYV